MKTFWLLGAAVIAFGFGESWSQAAPITLTPSSDTYITEHAGLGGPASTHANDPTLYSIRGTGTFLTFPLIKFDLTPYAGMTVVGPVTLQLFTSTVFPQTSPRVESVHAVLIGWNASTMTYNNFSPLGPGVHGGSDVGAALDTRSFVLDGSNPSRYLTWTIPASLVQQWINTPSSNNGFLLNNQITTNTFDVQFNSSQGMNPPRLTFQVVVPEPSRWLLFGGFAASLFAYGWRRRVSANGMGVVGP